MITIPFRFYTPKEKTPSDGQHVVWVTTSIGESFEHILNDTAEFGDDAVRACGLLDYLVSGVYMVGGRAHMVHPRGSTHPWIYSTREMRLLSGETEAVYKALPTSQVKLWSPVPLLDLRGLVGRDDDIRVEATAKLKTELLALSNVTTTVVRSRKKDKATFGARRRVVDFSEEI